MVHKIIPLIASLLLLSGCSRDSGSVYEVTFNIVVKNVPEDKKVFITGNQPELGDWVPDRILMDKINDSTFEKSIPFKEGTNLNFKITAGNWWFEALDKDESLKEFNLEVEKDTILSLTVYSWKNTSINGRIVLNQNRFKPNRTTMSIDNFWKYHPGDNPDWSKVDFNDSAWATADSYINWEDSSALKWKNVGWFRFHFIADSSLWNKSLAMLIGQLGASQIFYNGKLLYSFGEVGSSESSFQPAQNRIWKEIKIAPEKEQLIAVRYANYNWKEQQDLRFSPGFVIFLKDINTIFQSENENIRDASYHQMVFTLIPLILFFLHIFIFGFNPKQKENLFYAFCLLGFAGVTYFSFERFIATDPNVIILHYQLNGISVPITMFFGLMAFYAMIYNKIPRRWKLYFLLFIFISIINFLLRSEASIINYIFFGIMLIDIIVSSFRKKGKKNLKGGWIVLAGFIGMAVFIILQILLDFSLISPLTEYNQVFVYGMISFAISMSLFLSFNFSQINKDLETQLVKVKELSEKTLEQERIANKLELERRIIEAENERKTQELEEARKLQLSLLPKEIPELENFDIACYMNTATEVGGDYYDFIGGTNIGITIAIGDATGHGVKAGTLVAIVKGLLHVLSPELPVEQTLAKINTSIRSMQLGNLYMGLTLLKINNSNISISSAGMPPMLLFRRNQERIEDIIIKRMPLGATEKINFEEHHIKMNLGDTLLLLSDGLPELFNSNKEMFEYKRIREILANNAVKNPEEIIEELKFAADKWRNGSPQNDDITFIVIKHK